MLLLARVACWIFGHTTGWSSIDPDHHAIGCGRCRHNSFVSRAERDDNWRRWRLGERPLWRRRLTERGEEAIR